MIKAHVISKALFNDICMYVWMWHLISRLFLLFLVELAWSIECEIRIRKETEIGLETFGLEKKVSVLVSMKILVSSLSDLHVLRFDWTSANYNFLHPCALSKDSNLINKRWCIVMHCAISKVHPAMHQCTDAPHTSSASSQNCIAELFTKMSSSHHEHPQNYFASEPSDRHPSIAMCSSSLIWWTRIIITIEVL